MAQGFTCIKGTICDVTDQYLAWDGVSDGQDGNPGCPDCEWSPALLKLLKGVEEPTQPAKSAKQKAAQNVTICLSICFLLQLIVSFDEPT